MAFVEFGIVVATGAVTFRLLMRADRSPIVLEHACASAADRDDRANHHFGI
jgi:hypothetical protein